MSEKKPGRWWHRLVRTAELGHLLDWLQEGGLWRLVVALTLIVLNGSAAVWSFARGSYYFAGAMVTLAVASGVAITVWLMRARRADADAARAKDEALRISNSAAVAANAARRLIQEGRWVYGPRTAAGAGHSVRDLDEALREFDRTAAQYLGNDRDKLMAVSDQIADVTRSDHARWSNVLPLLDKLERWADSVAPIERHPLD